MDIKDYRDQLDEIDAQLAELFCRRMEICGEIASWKKENGNFRLSLSIPEGIPCKVIMPDGTEYDQTEISAEYSCEL